MIRRRLLTFLSALSLILCVGTVALWVRSYWRNDRLDWQSGNATSAVQTGFLSSGGKIYYHRIALPTMWHGGSNFQPLPLQFLSLPYEDISASPPGISGPTVFTVGFLGFMLVGDRESICSEGPLILELPDWGGMLLTLVLPMLWLRKAVRRRSTRGPARCTVCSYDLTGNLSGTCPECGIAPSKLGRGG
jgi:hypothetical protein